MTWLRVDDVFVDHPKVEALSDAAFRLHMRAMCYCARFRTDGDVPAAVVSKWAKPKTISECVAVGVWHLEGQVYVVHDFLVYNPSKADLDKKATAGAKGGAVAAANKYGRAHASESAQAPTRDPVPARPSPDPHPPHPEGAAAGDLLGRCVQAYDSMMGTMATTPTTQRQIADWLEANSGSAYDLVEWFSEACEKAALRDKRNLGYVFGILKRESREGRGDNRPASPDDKAERQMAEDRRMQALAETMP